jgi:hypothetical protein
MITTNATQSAVVRSGRFRLDQIPGIGFWFDFNDTRTVQVDGSGKIERINSVSGPLFASQGSGALRPTYDIGAYRGMNAASFAATGYLLGSAQVVFGDPDLTLITVSRKNSSANSWCHVQLGNNRSVGILAGRGTNSPGYINPNVSWRHDAGGVLPVGSVTRISVVRDAGTTRYNRLGGITQTISEAFASDSIGNFMLGASFNAPWLTDETLFEVAFWPRALNPNELSMANAYLDSKWSLR